MLPLPSPSSLPPSDKGGRVDGGASLSSPAFFNPSVLAVGALTCPSLTGDLSSVTTGTSPLFPTDSSSCVAPSTGEAPTSPMGGGWTAWSGTTGSEEGSVCPVSSLSVLSDMSSLPGCGATGEVERSMTVALDQQVRTCVRTLFNTRTNTIAA